jgi:hypothetical protein
VIFGPFPWCSCRLSCPPGTILGSVFVWRRFCRQKPPCNFPRGPSFFICKKSVLRPLQNRPLLKGPPQRCSPVAAGRFARRHRCRHSLGRRRHERLAQHHNPSAVERRRKHQFVLPAVCSVAELLHAARFLGEEFMVPPVRVGHHQGSRSRSPGAAPRQEPLTKRHTQATSWPRVGTPPRYYDQVKVSDTSQVSAQAQAEVREDPEPSSYNIESIHTPGGERGLWVVGAGMGGQAGRGNINLSG